jgi:MYXO-CTERM domain-containing protein
MVGSRAAVVGAALAFAAVVATSERATACSIAPPPPALVGIPAPDAGDVPTNVLPIYLGWAARIYVDLDLTLVEFELASAAGEPVAVTARRAFTSHFELVPDAELEPLTEYTLRVTVPPSAQEPVPIELGLSFTTGSGPTTEPPEPPSVSMQHYISDRTSLSGCGPDAVSSCIFFPGMAVEVSFPGSPYLDLYFDKMGANLSGVGEGTSYECAVLRTRGADGTMSEAVDICRDDADTFTLPDVEGLECTENGLVKNGVPVGGSGGTGGLGGTGGTGTGGVETGGTVTGGTETGGTGADGSGNTAGEPDEAGTRTIITEGCGCRVPRPTRGIGSAAWLVLGLSLLALRRRRV